MKMSRHKIIVFILIFTMLTGAYSTFFALATRANHTASLIYEERHTLISAMYEASLASVSSTRWMRFFVVNGGQIQYDSFWLELELDRVEQTLETFIAYHAPQNEITIIEQVIAHRIRMSEISIEAINLRNHGFYQEAVNLAHGQEFASLGQPLEGMIQEVITLVNYRTQSKLESAVFSMEIYQISMGVIMIILAIVGLVSLSFVGKSRRVMVSIVLLVVLICFNAVLSVRFAMQNNEQFDTYELRDTLVGTLYDVHAATEALTRWSRMFAVTGEAFAYEGYMEELAKDRFNRGLDTFIVNQAQSAEINVFVDLTRWMLGLRQLESVFLQLRHAGYADEAIAMAFGAEFAALGLPMGQTNQSLRDAVSLRIANELVEIYDNQNHLRHLIVVNTFFIFVIGMGGLLMLLKKGNIQNQEENNHFIRRRMRHATITTRLITSFLLIFMLFILYAAISTYLNNVIDNYNRHNIEIITPRIEISLSFHQEFTEMRRLIRASFMNAEWRETSNEGIWRSFEVRVNHSFTRLNALADEYKESVRNDRMFPEQPYDSRIFVIEDIMDYVTSIYDVFNMHFFWDGDMSFYHGDILDYAEAAETMLMMLRQMGATNQGIMLESIESYRAWSNTVTIIALVAFMIVASFLAYTMVRTFTGRIKAIEASAILVAHGDFSATLENMHEDEISKIFKNLINVITKLMSEIQEVTEANKKGNTSTRINPILFQGKYKDSAVAINALLDTVEEMIDQKEKMQIAEANSQAKSKFLASMSHEIRTPLTAVLGISEIQLHNTNLPLEIEEAFAKIYSSSNTLLRIVNDILDLSKIEAGKMELHSDKYEVASMLCDVAQLNLAYLGSKRLKFVVDASEKIPSYLIGDELRIKQVLNNLFSNAFKYTEKGSVEFNISVKDDDSNPNMKDIIFIIRDTGRGMSDAQLKALFDEYSRFHEKEFRFESGTGLGMPITYNLLEMMNATITVNSKIGEGTTVTVCIPQEVGNHEPIGAETARLLRHFNLDANFVAKRLAFTPEPMPHGKVLIVDDVDANLYVVKGIMNLYKLQIDTCTSGRAAIKKIKNGEVYDIIFMD
ncbi:MAG: ATP-binding protein [Defluviitaleaceae bacterium]|nr:ATP-binding protein [Defluviitaleaceae bacterium]